MNPTAIVLGCGTSHGVPMIGCSCAVCCSDDQKNKRTRSALFLSGEGYDVLIDAPPELRLQLCRENISHIDRVVITHSHADHVMGLDDLRRLYEMTGDPVRVLAQPAVLDDLRRIYRYAFEKPAQLGGGIPNFSLFPLGKGDESPSLTLLPLGEGGRRPDEGSPSTTLQPDIELFEVMHGTLPVLGIKVRGFAYLTDVSSIPDAEVERLTNLETLIIDATRIAPHSTHLNLEGALQTIEELKPDRAYLTHLSHDYDYAQANAILPKGTELSYDGLRIPIS
jgi:phosphoribosyl 1,2-cyclic phosphate phosphodiesterase